uniref:RNA helicase n=4 Tax=Kalanchoe fedtschenkoi TaxID=63787 RepID=A0A7N0RJX1_KALFE
MRCPTRGREGEGTHIRKFKTYTTTRAGLAPGLHSSPPRSQAFASPALLRQGREPTSMTRTKKKQTATPTPSPTQKEHKPVDKKKKKAQNQNKQGEKTLPDLDETTRNLLTHKLLEIQRSNPEEGYTFEEELSNPERKFIHMTCRKMGLISKSKGKGSQRRITVRKYYRPKATEEAEGRVKLTHLTFSQEGIDVMRDLFTSYPPNDEETRDELVYQRRKSSNHMRADYDLFSKPALSKESIAKKQQVFESKKNSQRMRQIIEKRSQLPIAPYKDYITTTVNHHQVVLISGETGCGKTTQVPQFILDSMWDKGQTCKIVCSQPRRISATSVAERIAAERGQGIGEDVGYKIRLESKGGKNTSIVFCTNGILLKILVSKGSMSSTSDTKNKTNDVLSKLTHIIVDEIHERDRYSDFMLALLRDELPFYPHLRLIIMSATLDAEMFSNYFDGCPVIRVPGFTHPVKAFYLEDVIPILKSSENKQLPTSSSFVLDGPDLTQEDKAVLDEAITTAWSNYEFEPLLNLVQSEGTIKFFNYQHSVNGLTPLMVFAAKGRVDEVCMLLSLGADCSLRDSNGTTAVELAKRENQLDAVEVINNHLRTVDCNIDEEKKLIEKYIQSVNPQSVDVVLIEKLVSKICNDSDDGAILVFVPGWDDIKKIREALLASSYFNDESKFLILSLHSMVPSKDQKLVFQQPPAGCRKIILSTNIAETSVTIDDVVYVIDSGKMKEKSYDPYSNVSTLQSSWISKASVKQREGRAGRCQPGICYHLFTRDREATLPSFQIPEIKRMPIEELCLQIKMMDPDCNIETILRKTIDPPVHETIRNGITVLQDIGALSHDERLTELGEKLGVLPVHPLVSKMLFLAILLKCLDPALTFACASDYKDPFVFPIDGRERAAAAKETIASIYDGNSDQMAVIAAFECWQSAKGKRKESLFCKKYSVSSSTMHMLSGLRMQLLKELRRHGFLPGDISSYNINAHDPGIIHAVLVAGLYPMVGRLIAGKSGRTSLVEIPNGAKVRLHHRSAGSGLSFRESCKSPLIIYDEITRTDYGESIRDCTVIGPLPLLLTATEIAVAPIAQNSEASDGDSGGSHATHHMEMCDDSSGDSKDVMSSPTREVMVIVDRWLSFGLTAIDFAHIYCLRERVSRAVAFTVTHPGSKLPVALAASMHALACLLSYDGLSNMGLDSRSSKRSSHGETSNNFYDDSFLLSLLSPAYIQNMRYRNSRPEYGEMSNFHPVPQHPSFNQQPKEWWHALDRDPRIEPPSIQPALLVNPSPPLPGAIQLHPSMESLSLGESSPWNHPSGNAKKKKQKSATSTSSLQNPSEVTQKSTLVGYGATTYGPYGLRTGVGFKRGGVGVKRRRGAP